MTKTKTKAAMTAAQMKAFDALEKKLTRCRFCAGLHAFSCPYLEEVEFDEKIKPYRRVKFRREHFRDLKAEIVYGPGDIPPAVAEEVARG